MHVVGAHPPDVPVAVTVLPMKPYQKCSPGPTRTDPWRKRKIRKLHVENIIVPQQAHHIQHPDCSPVL